MIATPKVPASADPSRFRLTADQFQQIGAAGIFHPEDRLELVDGALIEMSPIGSRHAAIVIYLTELFISRLIGRAIVSSQGPLRLSERTELYPDVMLLRPRADRYISIVPTAADALLVVEVADTSFAFDHRTKLPLYAAAGVPEYWLLDLTHTRLLVHRHPDGDLYREAVTLERGTIAPLAFPQDSFDVASLLAAGVR